MLLRIVFLGNRRPALESASNLQSFGVQFRAFRALLRLLCKLTGFILGVGYTGSSLKIVSFIFFLFTFSANKTKSNKFLKNIDNRDFSAKNMKNTKMGGEVLFFDIFQLCFRFSHVNTISN